MCRVVANAGRATSDQDGFLHAVSLIFPRFDAGCSEAQ
jgi:hypothetical protein